ncbi:Hypothetical predicted protein [Cloeon dipterum]|uniref:Caspase family p20 domain-containing protein n=1 Tax=Cloeon dipterum TaxID=197152 RepID=A0A8S1DF71_9INSE|nr:Hypothetical predicted protein [Cloeon dipterum]
MDKDKDKYFGYITDEAGNPARTWVLVIHHDFENTEDARAGNEIDVSKLCSTFTKRNCRFRDLKSKTKDEILSYLESGEKLFALFEENNENESNPDMLMIFILSHGSTGGTIFTDNLVEEPKDPDQPFEEYHTHDVWNGLMAMPRLQDCIKLIFFGPCRGLSGEIRLPASKESLEKNAVDNKSMWFSVQPNCENFIIFYSTVETVRAQRNSSGTWLVTALCAELDCMTKDLDLIDFLTRVKRRICDKTTINNEIGQTPQLQFSKHNAFTVSSFPLEETSDAKSRTPRDHLVKPDRYHFYSWKSSKHLLFRRGRALIFNDKNHTSEAKEIQISFKCLDFETKIYSVSRLKRVVREVISVHNSGLFEDGAIVICVLARLLQNSEFGLTIATSEDKRVAVNEITHSFIGTKSMDLAGKPKLFFFLDGGYRDDSTLIGSTPEDYVMEANNHGEIYTFFGVARSEEDNILSGFINELRNPELMRGLSLQEAVVNLLRRYEEPSGEIQFQIVSTLCRLVDFPPCRNAYVVPTFQTKNNLKTAVNFQDMVAKMINVALQPEERWLTRTWLLLTGTGIGKTAATLELARRLRETLPDTFLVITFSFRKYTNYFYDLKMECEGDFKPWPDWSLEFLQLVLEKDSESSDQLRIKIKERNVFLLADGFDEICPEYENIAVNLLLQFNEARLPLWVTSRNHGVFRIQDKIFKCEEFDLRPLTREEQVELLKIFLYKDNAECAALLDKFNGGGKSDFTGTPMQLKLVAEINDQVRTFDGGLNSLYHQFVLSKIQFYLEDYCGTKKSHKKYESSMLEAMDVLVELTVASYFFQDQKVSREIIRRQHDINHIGIVRFSINEEKKLESVTFEHQTYAEFLLSVLFLSKCGHNLSKSSEPLCQFIDGVPLSDLLLQIKFDQVRSFIDSYFLGAAGEARFEATELEKSTASALQQRKIDLMAFVCKEGHCNLFKLLFESKIRENFGDIKTLLNTPYEYVFNGNTYSYYPVFSACLSNEMLALRMLELGAYLDLVHPDRCRTENNTSILHVAAKRNFTKMADKIVDLYPGLLYEKGKRNMLPVEIAASRGNLEFVKVLINKLDSENMKNFMRQLALRRASINGHTEMVLYLMGEDFDLKKDVYGDTPLCCAAQGGMVDLVRALLEKIPDAANEAHVCTYGKTAVHAACQSNQVEVLQILYDNGASLSSKYHKRARTPLHTAVSTKSFNCIKYLIDQGEDINVKDSRGETLTHDAASVGQLETLQLLKEYGADFYAESLEYQILDRFPLKLTPLDRAALQPHIDCLNYLLDFPYSVEMKKQSMWLTLARASGDIKEIKNAIKLFQERGLSTDTDLTNGETPIIVLAQRSYMFSPLARLTEINNEEYMDKHDPYAPFFHLRAYPYDFVGDSSLNPFIDCIKYLIDIGADVNVVSEKKGSALHIAAGNGDVPLVVLLLSHGAQPFITSNPFGDTPLHSAAKNGCLEVVKILLSQEGVDVNPVSTKDGTPVLLALKEGNTAVVEYLLTFGAKVQTPYFHIAEMRYYTLALLAAEMGLRRELEVILGVAPFDDDQVQLDTALIGAARGGNVDLLHDLVQMGASFVARSDLKFIGSPLTVAVLAGKKESIKALFELMDLETQKAEAITALETAVEIENTKLAFLPQEEGDIFLTEEADSWSFVDIVEYFFSLDLLHGAAETILENIKNENVRNRLLNRRSRRNRLLNRKKLLVNTLH